MGSGASGLKSSGKLKGLSFEQIKELEDLGDMASNGRSNAAIDPMNKYHEGLSAVGSFETKWKEMVKEVAAKNGIADDFNFDYPNKPYRSLGQYERVQIEADEYAFSSRPGAEKGRRWIVNTIRNAPYEYTTYLDQQRFEHIEDALAYAKKVKQDTKKKR
jgi:hypothetical protein